VGLTIEYVAWTIGLGAAIASVFGRRYAPMPMHAPVPAR
jgi:hypothetical protein